MYQIPSTSNKCAVAHSVLLRWATFQRQEYYWCCKWRGIGEQDSSRSIVVNWRNGRELIIVRYKKGYPDTQSEWDKNIFYPTTVIRLNIFCYTIGYRKCTTSQGVWNLHCHGSFYRDVIQEKSAKKVNIAGHMPAPRKPYDSYPNMYNPGWRDHHNLNDGGNRQSNFSPNRQQGYQQ